MYRDIVVNKAWPKAPYVSRHFSAYRAYGIFNSWSSIRKIRCPNGSYCLSQKFPLVDVPRGIETNKAVTEVGAVYDIAPSRTPLLVSMTNRCLLVGSARRRHSTLRLFHEKPGRHLSFSRVCAPSNLSDNVFTKKVCRLSEKNILARFVYVVCRTNIVKIIFSIACFSNIFIYPNISYHNFFSLLDQLEVKDMLITVVLQLIIVQVILLILSGRKRRKRRKMWNAMFSIPRSFHLIKAS